MIIFRILIATLNHTFLHRVFLGQTCVEMSVDGNAPNPLPMKRFILLSVSVLKNPDLEKSLSETDRMLIDRSSLQWCSEPIDTALKPPFQNEVNAHLRNRKEMGHSMRMWLTLSVWHSSLKPTVSIIRDFMTHDIWEDRFLKKDDQVHSRKVLRTYVLFPHDNPGYETNPSPLLT